MLLWKKKERVIEPLPVTERGEKRNNHFARKGGGYEKEKAVDLDPYTRATRREGYRERGLEGARPVSP